MKLILIFFAGFFSSFLSAQSFQYTVSKDKSSKYHSIQEVLNAIPSGNTKPVKIFVTAGVYNEVVVVDASKSNITLIGEDVNTTIINFNNHAGVKTPDGDTLNTWTCATVFIYGNDFQAQNISFSNQAGFTAGQAVAVRVEGNRASFSIAK